MMKKIAPGKVASVSLQTWQETFSLRQREVWVDIMLNIFNYCSHKLSPIKRTFCLIVVETKVLECWILSMLLSRGLYSQLSRYIHTQKKLPILIDFIKNWVHLIKNSYVINLVIDQSQPGVFYLQKNDEFHETRGLLP